MNKIPFFFRPRFRLYYDTARYPLLNARFKGDVQQIGNRLKANQVIFQARKLAQNLKSLSLTENPLNIAFITLGGSYGMYVDHVLAEALRAAGHDVTFFIDDSCLPVFEGHQWDKPETWKRTSDRGYFVIRNILDNARIPYNGFSEVQHEADSDDTTALENFSDILEASLLRHYRVGILTKELTEFERRKALFEQSIAISANVGRVIVAGKYDRVIMNHGLYSSTGPARRIIQNAGIPVLTHDRAKRKHCLNFTWNQSSDKWDISKIWEQKKDIPLTADQLKKVNEYLKSRIQHSGDRLVYNFGDQESPEKLADRLKIRLDKPVYTLFTNVLWDAASSQREIVFKNPVEWVVETIRWFEANPELQLLVKIHPAEVVIGTRQPFIDVLKEHIKQIPENVVIIPPDEKINSWSVYDITDLGIVHTTTAGMEMPLVGVPVVVVSNTHYRNKGFTLDVNSQEEYFETLQDFGVHRQKVSDFEKNLAKKYAYYLFEEYQFRFPFFYEPEEIQVRGLKFCSTDLSILKSIIQRIETLSPIRFEDA